MQNFFLVNLGAKISYSIFILEDKSEKALCSMFFLIAMSLKKLKHGYYTTVECVNVEGKHQCNHTVKLKGKILRNPSLPKCQLLLCVVRC